MLIEIIAALEEAEQIANAKGYTFRAIVSKSETYVIIENRFQVIVCFGLDNLVQRIANLPTRVPSNI